MSNDVDFTLRTGRNWKFTVAYFEDESETTAFDLTDYAPASATKGARVGIVDAEGNPVPLNGSGGTINNTTNTYAVIATPATGGLIDVNVPASVTKYWVPGIYYYDLVIMKDTNNIDPVVQGQIKVERGFAQ